MSKVGKRRSPDYTQIFGYVRKELAVKFKTFCTAKQLEQSEVIEKLLQQWVIEQENEEKQK